VLTGNLLLKSEVRSGGLKQNTDSLLKSKNILHNKQVSNLINCGQEDGKI
jgi:hypothetical protein